MHNKPSIPRVCEHCGKPFLIRPNQATLGQGRFCGHRCAILFRQGSTLAERFWKRVRKTDTCWLWMGAHSPDGYGRIVQQVRPTTVILQAHRVSYELHLGSIPDGKVVCHACDVRGCVNPAHLFLGDIADNVADCVAKGRNARGERNWRARLTEMSVTEIRRRHSQDGIDPLTLAQEYGVSRSAIYSVLNHKTWRHLR